MNRSGMGSRKRPVFLAALMLAVAVLVLAACGGGGDTSGESSSSGGGGGGSSAQLPGKVAASGETTPPPIELNSAAAKSALTKYIPKKLQQYYSSYDLFASLGPNPYKSWTPPKAPYKMCYSETFLKNTWRQDALKQAEDLVEELAEEGIADGPLTVTNADGDIGLQSSQINQMVEQGCDVIWAFTAGPTGICQAVDNAHEHGVLFMSVETPIDCKNAMNVDYTDQQGGSIQATYLAHELEGEGNIVMLTGIPGLAVTTARTETAKAVFEQVPGIEIVGSVRGDFTASTAKAAMQKWLVTHPGTEVDGLWDGGAMATAAAQAFTQAGRTLPKVITNLTTECSFLAYWKENELNSVSVTQSPYSAIVEAWVVTKRMLEGDKPVANLFLYPTPQVTNASLDEVYEPDMTVDSTCFAHDPEDRAVPDSYFDPMFE